MDIATKAIAKLQSLGHTAHNVRPSSTSSVPNSLQKRCDADLYNSLGSGKIASAIVEGLTGVAVTDSTSSSASSDLITEVEDTKLKAQIAALQYNMNLDHNSKLKHTDGNIYQETLDNVKSIGNIIRKDHKSQVVLWLQQKLE